jgi:alcohol dehydrogenase
MSERYYEFFCPVKILAGHHALEQVPFELATLGAKRPLLVTDAGVRRAGLVDVVVAALEAGGINSVPIFDAVPPDSSKAVVAQGAELSHQHRCDSLVALGGGSVIDTAKAVNVLTSLGGHDLAVYAGSGKIARKLTPLFVLPTTSGTGSEATNISVIKDETSGLKHSYQSPFLMPDAAVLDPRLTLGLPPFFTAATGMDALTHAIESYVCMQKNPLSDAFATKAIEKIARNLVAVLEVPKDAHGRLELAQAATFAGIAFSNSMVGLVHALGHTLGAVAHLPHGVCMSVFLPYVLEFNLDVRREAIGELLLPLAGAEVYARTPVAERAEASIARIRKLRDELYRLAELPRTLVETGQVKREDLPRIADLSVDDAALAMNPKDVSRAEALAVLERAFG